MEPRDGPDGTKTPYRSRDRNHPACARKAGRAEHFDVSVLSKAVPSLTYGRRWLWHMRGMSRPVSICGASGAFKLA